MLNKEYVDFIFTMFIGSSDSKKVSNFVKRNNSNYICIYNELRLVKHKCIIFLEILFIIETLSVTSH